MRRLIVLFVLVPALELALLIEVGRRIGPLNTVALIIVTGILGAALARRQGLSVLEKVRWELAAGRVPASSLVDGIMILVAAALLITPGILTDGAGFLFLIPGTRRLFKRFVGKRIENAVREGRMDVSMHFEHEDVSADSNPSSNRPGVDRKRVGDSKRVIDVDVEYENGD